MTGASRFLGVDLAVQAKNTGVVLVELRASRAYATWPDGEASDDALVSLVDASTVVGVDAPLGWPVDFVDSLGRHDRFEGARTWDVASLRYRETDRFVHALTNRQPLSVSADLIGGVAMRAAGLQARWALAWGAVQPRDGSGQLIEVYPRAALEAWGLREPGERYKGTGPRAQQVHFREAREGILHLLQRQAPWLTLEGDLVERCVASDHVLDALVSALVAVAATRVRTHGVPHDAALVERARREGWIHVPSAALHDLLASPA